MRIFALVGRNGSGKSHKAIEIAKQFGLEYIIDDGALIKIDKDKTVKIAGVCIDLSPSTIKRKIRLMLPIALFEGRYSKEVKDAIKGLKLESILIISTSVKMIEKIIENLGLPPVHKIIKIEEISTPEEIKAAIKSRQCGGRVNLVEHSNTKLALSIFEGVEKDNKKSLNRQRDIIILDSSKKDINF